METKELQAKFLELAKKSEELSEQKSKIMEELDAVMLQLNYIHSLQDPETGIVYQIVQPTGRFVHFKTVDYIRTKKEGERAGSLSVKKAEELGFVVSK